MVELLSPSWCGLEWSSWIALPALIAEYKRCITRDPGFYRARVEAQEAVGALVARYPKLRASGRPAVWKQTPGFRGLAEFWVAAR